jgi:hypothetical protein
MAERVFLYKPPVEAVEGARGAGLKPVGQAVAAAALVSLLLGSKPLLDWANELPIGPVSDVLLFVAQDWDDTAGALGLTRYGEAIRYWLRGFEGER